MKTYVYRASYLKSTITLWSQFHGRSQFLAPAKNHRFLRYIPNHNNNNNNHFHHQLLQTGFLRVLKRTLDTILPEKCAFIAVLCGQK